MALRAAVIGVGYLGQFHAQKIKNHPEAELVGVCDVNLTQAQKVAADLHIQAFANPKDLIKKVDYVHIAASTQVHYDLAKIFLNEKIPVLVEKPIASTVHQGEELCEIAEKNQVMFSVGHIERFNPTFQFLKEKAAKIRYLEINRLAPFRVRGSDVSVLHDLTIHDIDLVSWIFSSKIKHFEVYGKKLVKETYDDVSIRLALESGVQISLNNSRISPQIVRNYRAICEDETISVNTATLEGEIFRSKTEDPFYEVEKKNFVKVDALALEVDHFIQCLLNKKKLAITGREATEALKNIEKFIFKLDGIN